MANTLRVGLPLLLSLLVLSGCGGGGGGTSSALPQTAAVAPSSPPSSAPVTPASYAVGSAQGFIDSIGICTHMWWDGFGYDNWPLALQRLKDLGVRHVRDSATFPNLHADRFRDLAAAGIGVDAIFDPRGDAGWTNGAGGPALAAWVAQNVAAIPSLDALEGPNEYDRSSDAQWPQTLATFQRALYSAAKANASTANLPVIGPSLTGKWGAAGNLSDALDTGNVHDYPGGANPGAPGSGSIAANLAAIAAVSAAKPVWSTETGYGDAAGDIGAVPDAVQARYVPRTFLEHYLAGVPRTYLYQLVDAGSDGFGSFGLVRADGTPKPAYTALANLIALLRDPGAAFTPPSLTIGLADAGHDLHRLVLQKRDGTVAVVLWREVPAASAVSANATLALGTATSADVIRFDDDGNTATTTVAPANGSLTVPVDDHVVIVCFARS